MVSTIKKVFKPIEQLLEIAGDVHTISAIVGAFGGKKPADDAPVIAKGVSGIFGKKDEREMFRLFRSFEDGSSDEARLLKEFFAWQYSKEGIWTRDLQKIWVRNAFNTFVTGFVGQRSKKSETSIKTEVKKRDGTITKTDKTKVEYDDQVTVDKLALDFFKYMADFISNAQKDLRAKHPRFKAETVKFRAFKALTDDFAGMGVPYMPPPGTKNPVEWVLSESSPAMRGMVNLINKRYESIEDRTARLSWFERFMLEL